MAVSKNNYLREKREYTVLYRDMRGVDFTGSGAEISKSRFAYAENMYRDYDGDGGAAIESFPGFRKIASFGKKIHGIYQRTGNDGTKYIIVHAGEDLCEFWLEDYTCIDDTAAMICIEDAPSHAFCVGDGVYVFDGKTIARVGDDGGKIIRHDDDITPYTPTTYVNGEEYEQKNLLTSYFIERTFISSADEFGYGSKGLSYKITKNEDMTCEITGAVTLTAELNIPSAARLDGKRYKVETVAASAFRNTEIEYLKVAEGVRRIGAFAFSGCSELVSVTLPDSVEYIDSGAFSACPKLTHVQLGKGLKELGIAVFSGCTALEEVDYALGASGLQDVKNRESLDGLVLNYEVETADAFLEFPLYTPTRGIESLQIGGQHYPFTPLEDKGLVKSVLVYAENKHQFDGMELEIMGSADENQAFGTAHGSDAVFEAGITGPEAIYGCTVSTIFDGRIFLSGNPQMPNTVFYSERDLAGQNNPTYFGVLNYFNDGFGGFPVRSLLATSDALAVFKSDGNGTGTIFYHTPVETGIGVLPKIYPVSYVHTGIQALGDTVSFFDDPLFISPLGVTALEKKEINLERSIVCRSHNVNSRLLSEDLDKIKMTSWGGYLVLLAAGGNMYLGDSRQTFIHKNGGMEYEWYYLTGIGTYTDEEIVYRYATAERDGYEMHADGRATGIIMSVWDEYGDPIYYVEEDGKRYEVTPTEERYGGEFSPATAMLSLDGMLFFGTECGDLCVMNTDLRGIPPEKISEFYEFDEEEYASRMGRRIHPDFYSYAGHAPRYAIKTAVDDCGIPHLAKSTVKGSLTVKCKSFAAGTLTCEVGTDTSGYRECASFPATGFSFSDVDFSALSSNTGDSFTVPIAERERGWVEKQITLYSDEYASPFGIYAIAYRFTIKGKIKKT